MSKHIDSLTMIFVIWTGNIFCVTETLDSAKRNMNSSLTTNQNSTMCPTLIREIADSVTKNMDLTQDLCKDFYLFACGNWEKNNPLSKGYTYSNVLTNMNHELDNTIYNYLEKPVNESTSEAEKKAKQFYRSCINAYVEKKLLDPIATKNLLIEVGLWNVTEETEIKNWSLLKSLQALITEYNFPILFRWINLMKSDDSEFAIHIEMPFENKEYGMDKTENRWKKLFFKNFQKLKKFEDDMKVEEIITEKQFKDVMKLHENILQSRVALPRRLLFLKKPSQLMTLRDLQEEASFISWKDFFNHALKTVNKTVDDNTLINNTASFYIAKISSIVKNYQKTVEGKTTLKNYTLWKVIDYLYTFFVQPPETYDPVFECMMRTRDIFDLAVGALMYLQEEPNILLMKSKVEEVGEKLKTAFVENLENLDWLNGSKTKEILKIKISNMSPLVGFPEWTLNHTQLDQYYDDFDTHENQYLSNEFASEKFSRKKNMELFEQRTDESFIAFWKLTELLPSYERQGKRIIVPLAIFQKPMYDMQRPESMNFGALGTIIGHEMIYPFNFHLEKYRQKHREFKWWDHKTLKKFETEAQCFVDSYNKLKFYGQKIDGKSTLDANIADNGALSIAYKAYLGTPNNCADDIAIVVENFTLTYRQLFFVSHAQAHCTNLEPEAEDMISQNAYPPEMHRVNGTISNSKDFASAFSCLQGSDMNPKKKCKIY